jgi:hypothetical protein
VVTIREHLVRAWVPEKWKTKVKIEAAKRNKTFVDILKEDAEESEEYLHETKKKTRFNFP